MSSAAKETAPEEGNTRLFWACFISLIATAFGFIVRAMIMNDWAREFDLSATQKGEIFGVGLWPFAISIVLFSLVIDRIGYGRAMCFAFFCHVVSAVVTICAPMVLAPADASPEAKMAGYKAGYWMLYAGNFIVALGNGTVEAVINPVVATLFSKEKTKWLNILHAGWPGGLVLGGLLAISMAEGGIIANMAGGPIGWQYKVGLIFIPVVLYGIMMAGCTFPVNERVAAGSSDYAMFQEVGGLGALIVNYLIFSEIGKVFGWHPYATYGVIAAVTFAYAAYVRSIGAPIFIFLLFIMIPLATTELGTDSWITPLMEKPLGAMNINPGWLLVYTSFIMMVLRFFAGPIVHNLSPLGLLAGSSVLAAVGLYCLSTWDGVMILAAATIYGFGKTFFWPTMLGVVAEQFPKGGALTLNTMGGVGMLGVGVVGAVFTGYFKDSAMDDALKASDAKNKTQYVAELTVPKESIFGKYNALDQKKVDAMIPLATKAETRRSEVLAALKKTTPAPSTEQIKTALEKDAAYQAIVADPAYVAQEGLSNTLKQLDEDSNRGALKVTVIFPIVMFVCYIILIVYFSMTGGYKAHELTHPVEDDKDAEKYTPGGIPAAVE